VKACCELQNDLLIVALREMAGQISHVMEDERKEPEEDPLIEALSTLDVMVA
jgi:hypothetical protein